MTDFLFYGDTERSAAMRHELPVPIGDPFLLGVLDGRLHVMTNSLERSRVAAVAPDAVLHDITDLGLHDLLGSGIGSHELELELTLAGRRRRWASRRCSPTPRCRWRSPTGCAATA